MLRNATPLTDVSLDPRDELTVKLRAIPQTPAQSPTIWVSRITGVIGMTCLLLSLFIWFERTGHYRTVLALLTVAMFAAILHSYVFEDN